jgi:membrane protein DedA with SNARE-associated domain
MSLLDTLADNLEIYGYPVLFVGVLLENAGVPVPGETVVLLAGYLSSPPGGARLSVGWVIAVTVIAAVLGDNLGFWLGREWARPRLQAGRRFLFLTPRSLQFAEGYFTRYGLWTVFFARFVSGLRVIGALAAGTAGMRWSHFLMANAGGAVAWATSMALLGYFFGHSWHLLHHWLGRGGMILLGALALLIGLPYLLRYLRRISLGQVFNVARARVFQGLLVAVLEVICIALLVTMTRHHGQAYLDVRIDRWIAANTNEMLDHVGALMTLLGSLPVLGLVTAATVVWLARRGRSVREGVAMIVVFLASEILGLILVGLLDYREANAIHSPLWPFGFSGSVPLRALAVYGMAAALVRRHDGRRSRVAAVVAAVLIVITGVAVVWTREQSLSETLLESAAGAIVLFGGIWWLEGLGKW